jgi:hypothetical protein
MSTSTPAAPAAKRRPRTHSSLKANTPMTTAPIAPTITAPQLPDLTAYQPTCAANPLGWDLRPARITCYGPDQRGTLRQYSDNARTNANPPLLGLAGLLLGVSILSAAGRIYLAIDLQGQLPEQINQLRLRIGTADTDRNWPVRTALYGLIAGDFRLGSEVGLSTRSGVAIFFLDVLHHSGRAVSTPRGYWSSPEAIGYSPLDILLAVNNLRRRLEQSDLAPEVFGDLLSPSIDISIKPTTALPAG